MIRAGLITLLTYALFFPHQPKKELISNTINPFTIKIEKIEQPLPVVTTPLKEEVAEVKEEEEKEEEGCFGNQESLSKKIYSQMGLNPPFLKPGRKVRIAVIDTGIDLENPLFQKAIPKPDKGYSEYNFAKGDTPQDYHGHGTHVAGVILGIYPEAEILPLKWGGNFDYEVENEVKALKYAIDAKVDIINISVDGPEYSEQEHRLLRLAKQKGILVVVSAGNHRSKLDEKFKSYPASFHLSNMIVVGNHDSKMEKYSGSNFSRKLVDTFALGTKLKSLALKNEYPPKCFIAMTGTSMAAPIVTGFAAILKHRFPAMSNREIRNIIFSTSRKSKQLETYSKFGHLEPFRILDYTPKPKRSIASRNKKSQQ